MWSISLDKQSISDSRIRRVSIDKFYELVTGNKTAFKELCEQLPLIIEDIINNMEVKAESNSVFSELEKIDPNLLKSIYLLSFKKYQGFDDFNI